MDILDREYLPFPESLPSFLQLFPDDAACATYMEKCRWPHRFACPHCGVFGDPFRFKNRPGVLRCWSCRKNTGLTVGTVMERSHMPLSVWYGPPMSWPARHPACPPCSFSDSLDCYAMRRRSAFSANSAHPWCVRPGSYRRPRRSARRGG